MTPAERDIKRKLRILNHAQGLGNVSKACRYFGISRDTFYRWKRDYAERGEAGLINSKPCPHNVALRTPPEIEEQILHLRRRYHLGQVRIAWYLDRYHQIRISPVGVYNVLKRNGVKNPVLPHGALEIKS